MPLRSAYTHFLISLHSLKEALNFTTQTLKYDRSDVYTFCALGWIHFTLGREAKSSSEVAERPKQYLRSAEAYERALLLDGNCAMAAQGLAIALAEDSLGLKENQPPVGSSEDLKLKMRLAGQSLAVLGRINDSAPDGNVAVNMGHCYFIRGEEEKAIQSVSTQKGGLADGLV
jgi:RNA polymerase-associated protein CTR9